MLWSMMRLIYLQTEFGDPPFFYVFNLILSFSTCSESFEKICTWELLGAKVLNRRETDSISLKLFTCTLVYFISPPKSPRCRYLAKLNSVFYFLSLSFGGSWNTSRCVYLFLPLSLSGLEHLFCGRGFKAS